MKKILSLSLGLIFIANFLSAQNFTAVATGAWNSNATWGTAAGVYPGAAAGTLTVTIPTDFAVTLNVSPAFPIGGLAIAVGNGNNSLAVSPGFTLNVTGGIVITGAVTGGGGVTKSLIMNGAGAVVNAASLTLTPGNTDDKLATVQFNGGGTINITGDLTMPVDPALDQRTQIIFNGGGGTLNVDGALIGGQISVIGAAGTSTINADPMTPGNLIMNIAGSILDLNGNVDVSGTLTLTAGKIDIGPNFLTLTNAVPATQLSGGNSTSYVFTTTDIEGFGLRRNALAATTAYTFPVGTPTDYMPVIVNSVSPGNNFAVSAYSPAASDALVGGPPFISSSLLRMVNAMWFIARTGTNTGNTTLTLQWVAGLEGASFAVLGNPSIGISRHDGTTWSFPPIQTSADNTANTVTATFTAFGAFVVADNGVALPVKFGPLNAYKKQSGIQLDWKVYSEDNVKNYEVERSADARSFNLIGSVNGTTSNSHNYTFPDDRPLNGRNYYRIRQVDKDGRFSYSPVIGINNSNVSSFSAFITPNPAASVMSLSIEGVKEKEILVFEIMNASGMVVHRENIAAGGTMIVKTLSRPAVSAGLYFYKITRSSNNETFSGRLVLQ